MEIADMAVSSGRMLRENDETVNIANVLSPIAGAFEQITIDDTVGGEALTALTYGTATRALITVETASVRIRIDSGVPTSTVGHLISSGSQIILESADDIASFLAIRATGDSAVISVTYFN